MMPVPIRVADVLRRGRRVWRREPSILTVGDVAASPLDEIGPVGGLDEARRRRRSADAPAGKPAIQILY